MSFFSFKTSYLRLLIHGELIIPSASSDISHGIRYLLDI